MYTDVQYQFQILMETKYSADGIIWRFKFYSEDGVFWSWNPQPDGLPDTGMGVTTVIPGSMFDPPDEVFGRILEILEYDIDGISPDTIGITGLTYEAYFPAGPPRPVIAFHLTPHLPDGADSGTICIDSAVTLLYYWDPGKKSAPMGTYPVEFDGPFCWPVKRAPLLGDFDLDGQITVGDVVEMIAVIFKGKPHPIPMQAGDANCDGSFNVGDVIFLINYIFKFGSAPGCP
jgi:hypothetical protein